MAVKYKVVSKKPGGMAGERQPRYFPMVTGRRICGSRELAEQISERCSFSTPDVMGMIETLIQVVPEMLQKGANVRLDGFGTFSLHISGIGRENPDKVTKRDINKVKMAFLPSKDVKRALAHTHFVKA